MVDIGQVEVLRGPQGALYSAGSLGGVLQLTTHRPDPEGFDAWASLTASTRHGGEAGGLASAMINMPLRWSEGGERASTRERPISVIPA